MRRERTTTVEKFIAICEQFTFTQFLTFIVFLTLGLKGLSEIYKGIKSNLEGWYQKKRGIEKKDETLEQRVAKLEESDEVQIDRLNTISSEVKQIVDSLANIQNKLNELDDNNKRRSVILSKSQLYRLHSEFMKRGYITMAEREMFDSLSDEYIACGGNSIYKDSVIPEVRSIEIRN